MNTIKKIFTSILVAIITFIPTYLITIAWVFLDPTDFWQKLVLTGIGLYLLGGIQLFLFVVSLMGHFFIWTELFQGTTKPKTRNRFVTPFPPT
jgi:hypothetical protein